MRSGDGRPHVPVLWTVCVGTFCVPGVVFLWITDADEVAAAGYFSCSHLWSLHGGTPAMALYCELAWVHRLVTFWSTDLDVRTLKYILSAVFAPVATWGELHCTYMNATVHDKMGGASTESLDCTWQFANLELEDLGGDILRNDFINLFLDDKPGLISAAGSAHVFHSQMLWRVFLSVAEPNGIWC